MGKETKELANKRNTIELFKLDKNIVSAMHKAGIIYTEDIIIYTREELIERIRGINKNNIDIIEKAINKKGYKLLEQSTQEIKIEKQNDKSSNKAKERVEGRLSKLNYVDLIKATIPKNIFDNEIYEMFRHRNIVTYGDLIAVGLSNRPLKGITKEESDEIYTHLINIGIKISNINKKNRRK